jgi:hypothetical protein
MPYAKVTGTDDMLVERTVYTDRFGTWLVTGTTALRNVRFEYLGLHVDVDHSAGDDYFREDLQLNGTENDIVLNEMPDDELRTAQANAYVVVNKVGDYIRDVACDEGEECDATKPDVSIVASVNEQIGCQSLANQQIHFNRATGTCTNGSYSTIVAHEYGHVLNGRYQTGDGDLRKELPISGQCTSSIGPSLARTTSTRETTFERA